jgi:hypothetical protein
LIPSVASAQATLSGSWRRPSPPTSRGVAVVLDDAAATDHALLIWAARGCPMQAMRLIGDDR